MLTVELLKQMEPGHIFAFGDIENSSRGVYMTNENPGRMLTWVAKRGTIHDWAIYIGWKWEGMEWVLNHGGKVTSPPNIKKLVPCDEEALKMYRF